MMTCVLRRIGSNGKRRNGMADGPNLLVKHFAPWSTWTKFQADQPRRGC